MKELIIPIIIGFIIIYIIKISAEYYEKIRMTNPTIALLIKILGYIFLFLLFFFGIVLIWIGRTFGI